MRHLTGPPPIFKIVRTLPKSGLPVLTRAQRWQVFAKQRHCHDIQVRQSISSVSIQGVVSLFLWVLPGARSGCADSRLGLDGLAGFLRFLKANRMTAKEVSLSIPASPGMELAATALAEVLAESIISPG